MNSVLRACCVVGVVTVGIVNLEARSTPVPPLADIATHARELLVAFGHAVDAGDSTAFVARFTPEARAVFTPAHFSTLFGQFLDKKISIPESRTAVLRFVGAPKFGVAGSLEARGFFLQDRAHDNLITFDLSWRIAGETWTMDGFGVRAFPKKGFPTSSQFAAVLAVVLAFNTAVETGDFAPVHGMLHRSAQEANSPQAMQHAFAKFTRDRVFARAASADGILFDEVPEAFEGGFMVVKAVLPVTGGKLSIRLMCAKDGDVWKVKDLRAFAE